MYLLECDFPFVVGFFTVHCDHGVESALKPQSFGVFLGFFKVLVSVAQEVPCRFFTACAQIEGEAKGFCVPIGASPVFFTSKAFGADVEARVVTCIGLPKVENVEADSLLGGNVAVNPYIGMIPNLPPAFSVLQPKKVVSKTADFFVEFSCRCNKLFLVEIAAACHGDKLGHCKGVVFLH